MRLTKKKLIAYLLTLVMLVNLFPVSALADPVIKEALTELVGPTLYCPCGCGVMQKEVLAQFIFFFLVFSRQILVTFTKYCYVTSLNIAMLQM